MALRVFRLAHKLSVCLVLLAPSVIAQLPTIHHTGAQNNPGQRIVQIRDLIGNGFFDKAARLLEIEIDGHGSSPHHDELLYLLTRCYIEQHRYEDAFQTSSRMLSDRLSGTRHRDGLYYKALSAYHTERFDAAAQTFDTLVMLESSPRRPTYYWYALTELRRGNYQRSAELARLAHESPPAAEGSVTLERTWFLWGIALENKGDIHAAREQFERLLRDHPTSPLRDDTQLRLASIEFRQGNNVRARSILEGLSTRFSPPETYAARQRHEWLFLLAEVEYRTRQYESAQKRYGDVLKEFPHGEFSRPARFGLAWTYLQLNKLDEASHEFQRLTDKTDSLAEFSLYQLGAIALLLDNTAGAVAAFEELLRRFPYDAYADRAYFQTGMMRYRARQYAEGRRQFQLAARLFPQSGVRVEAYRMLGEASLAVGDMRNAQFAFAQVGKFMTESSPPLPRRTLEPLLADARLKEGIALYHLGRFTTSAERFEEFVREHGNHRRLGDAHFWRGEALYQAGKFEEAEIAFTTALPHLDKGNTRRADALYGLSWALFEQKKFRKSVAAFDRFIEENPRSERIVDARLRQADCYFFLREYDSANQLYAKLADLRSDPRLAEYAAFQLGLSHIQRGDAERGVDHLRNFLRRYPRSLYVEVVQFNIAWAYFSREQYVKATEEFRLFELRYPESQLMPRVLLNSGDALYNLSMYDSARVYYRRVIEEYPASLLVPDATNGLQFTYRAQGRAREAVAAIEALVTKRAKGDGSEGLLMQKADILFDQGEFGQAAVEYLRILDLNPADSLKPKVLFQLGRIYELENNLLRATSYFNQVILDFPQSDAAPSSLLSLGLLATRQSQWHIATEHFRQFEQRYPESPLRWEAEYTMGVAQVNLKNNEAARTQFEKVIGLAPRDEVFSDRSRLQIARMDQSTKRYHAAIDTLTDVVLRRDDDIAAEALLLMGEVYLALKKPSDALRSFTRVTEGFSTFPLLVERGLLGSGECYERLNDRSQAREMYARVVDSAIDPAVKKDAEERLRRLRR